MTDWIPCAERMPTDDESVLIWAAGGYAKVAYLLDADLWLSSDGGPALPLSMVTHWMPIQPPPTA